MEFEIEWLSLSILKSTNGELGALNCSNQPELGFKSSNENEGLMSNIALKRQLGFQTTHTCMQFHGKYAPIFLQGLFCTA